MSQYYTYENLKGTVPIDIYMSDPNCKTCGLSKCYNTYDNVKGVSSSIYAPISNSFNDNKIPTIPSACDISSLSCSGADIITNDPYNIMTKTIGTCDISKPKFYEISVPQFPISLDVTKKYSPRIGYHNQERNSSFNAGVIEPAFSRENYSVPSVSIRPFDYLDHQKSKYTNKDPSTLSSVHANRYKSFESIVGRDYLYDQSESRPSKSISRLSKSVSHITKPKPLISKPSISIPVSKPSISIPVSKPSISIPVSKPSISVPLSKPLISALSQTKTRIPIVNPIL
jgi:hypothetical protein